MIAQGVTEAGCMAHARRKFFELQEHGQSQIAGEALARIAALYAIEQTARELNADARQALRETQAKPLLTTSRPGCWPAEGRSPTAHPAPRPSTTPSSVGRR
ncbi:MAG: transposase [Zoogloea sp.]|nr:transposase [Zoogloea sp.]